MSKWDKISLGKFQQIAEVNAGPNISDIDKALFTTCIVFDMTEYQLDNTEPKKALKLIRKTQDIFSGEFTPRPVSRICGHTLNYNVASITFGQYIDLSFFLQSHIQHAHFALASISCAMFRRYTADGHRDRSDRFLNVSVEKVMGALLFLIERLKNFNKEYAGLFGLDAEVNGEEAKADKFVKRYGWLYSASQVAEYERISLEQTLALPIRQALNDLAYLKSKVKYESELQKRMLEQMKNNNHGE